MKKYFVFLCAMLSATASSLLYSCKEEPGARLVVEDFMNKNMKSPDFEIEEVSDIDSTGYVTDSMVQIMRTTANTLKTFKKVNYGNARKTPKLFYVTVKYTQAGEKYNQTFYMDNRLQHVVAFKNN